jgi:hypothetical protein
VFTGKVHQAKNHTNVSIGSFFLKLKAVAARSTLTAFSEKSGVEIAA